MVLEPKSGILPAKASEVIHSRSIQCKFAVFAFRCEVSTQEVESERSLPLCVVRAYSSVG